MIDENLQFAISQYLDGTLEPQEAAQLEVRLRSDAEARKVLEEFRRLNDLVNVAMPVPEMDWEKFTHQISAAVDREGTAAVPMSLVTQASRNRWASPRVWAMAAGLLLCASVAVIMWRTGRPAEQGQIASKAETVVPVKPQAAPEERPAVVASVEVFRAEQSAGNAVVDVSVSKAIAPYAQPADGYPDLVTQRASVTISALPNGDFDADNVLQ